MHVLPDNAKEAFIFSKKRRRAGTPSSSNEETWSVSRLPSDRYTVICLCHKVRVHIQYLEVTHIEISLDDY